MALLWIAWPSSVALYPETDKILDCLQAQRRAAEQLEAIRQRNLEAERVLQEANKRCAACISTTHCAFMMGCYNHMPADRMKLDSFVRLTENACMLQIECRASTGQHKCCSFVRSRHCAEPPCSTCRTTAAAISRVSCTRIRGSCASIGACAGADAHPTG